MLFTFYGRLIRFFFQGDREITRKDAYEDIMLRVQGFLAFDFRFFQYVGDSMDFSIVRRRLCVFLMGIATFQLTMQAVISSGTSALIGLSAWPFR